MRIANTLLVTSQSVYDWGLLSGKMGIAIYLYEYSRFSKEQVYGEYADQLIDEITENLTYISDIDLASGVCGIAYGINYLLENQFLEGNADDVLEELDQKILNSITFPIQEQLSSSIPIYSPAIYFLQRYKNMSISRHSDILKKIYDQCINYISQETPLPLSFINSIVFFLKEYHTTHNSTPFKTEFLINKYLISIDAEESNSVDLLCAHKLIGSSFNDYDKYKLLERIEILWKTNNLSKPTPDEWAWLQFIYFNHDKSNFSISELNSSIDFIISDINYKQLSINGLSGIGKILLSNLQ